MTQPTYSKRRKRDSDAYAVYDVNDNFVFSGTVHDICLKLDITKSCVCKAIKYGHVIKRKYRIFYEGD